MHASPQNIIADYLRLLGTTISAPEVSAPDVSTARPIRDASRPCALLLSPHPDDECLTGILPLRLHQEHNWQIINVAVTLGSNIARRSGRNQELARACKTLGFECTLAVESGFSDINADAHNTEPELWNNKVTQLAEIISSYAPEAIFMPHAEDWNATHIGTHLLGMDALAKQPDAFYCKVIQTEYWQPMNAPNLMTGISADDTAKLMSALACHTEEVARNPYDRKFPAYLIDNVRRGGERLNGKGISAPEMNFASMYKMGIWKNRRFIPSALNRFVSETESVGDLFE